MTERAQRIADLVEFALERHWNERIQFLDKECSDDVDLRKEVESLLQFHEKATDFIEKPAYEIAADAVVDVGGELKTGEMLGDYKIVSLISEGGMGEVYLAEDTALGRKVAIKLLKFGLGTSNIIRHFQQEERILAGLIHPNVAQLYGGAVTGNGLPYFVMEYVDGLRLDDYCREKFRLSGSDSILQRLELFRKICAAVAYAHQHLVVHRDIKPANIRVRSDGEPKLLDFGIAKLLDPATSTMEATMTFAAVMTPEYASPEQVRGETITTASDIYSLGVVLYELLTGEKPYKIDKRSQTSVAKAITEQEPTRPSMAVARRDGSAKSQIPSHKLLRGDLDNIVLKALRKEPARRYASVRQFSEDIRRHLEGRPVIARKDTIGYRTSKFIARNKVAVAAAVLIFLAIIGGLIGSLWQAQNARHQRDVAELERLKAQRINEYLQEMLGAAAPSNKGIDVKVIDVLGEASRRAKEQGAAQPDVMADVLTTLGRTYIALGQYKPAAEDLRVARDLSLKANGELHPTTAAALGWLGLALTYLNQQAEGEPISRKAVELQRKLHPEGNGDLGVALYSWGANLSAKGDPKSAEPKLEEAVDLIAKQFGKNHGYHLATLTLLGTVREKLGNLEGAEALYREAIKVGRVIDRRYRVFLAQAAGMLGSLLVDKGAYDEAEGVLGESASVYREVMGDVNSSTPVIQNMLGRLYFTKGDYGKAETEYRKAYEVLPKFFPREHFLMTANRGGLGLTLTRLQKAREGEPYLREALKVRKKILPASDPMIPFTESALGECLAAQKRFPEAEPLITRGFNDLKSKLGEKDRRVIEARERLVKLYEAWNKPAEAAAYR